MKQILIAIVVAAVNGAGPAATVSVTIEGEFRLIRANGLPDHEPGQFPNRGNPNRISAQHYSFRVPVKPQVAAQPTPAQRAWFGVAVNGVPFEPGTAEFWNRDPQSGWNYEAKGGSVDLGLDPHNAHVQPNGSYHYHGVPTGLVGRLAGADKKLTLVGWAADGFPIYVSKEKVRSSYRLKSGERPGGPGGKHDGQFTEDYEYVKGRGDLDECNGRVGVTPEFPDGSYHYYITDEFPYISRLWRGPPDPSFQKRGPGPPRPPPGR